jgi:hypothetical protein
MRRWKVRHVTTVDEMQRVKDEFKQAFRENVEIAVPARARARKERE